MDLELRIKFIESIINSDKRNTLSLRRFKNSLENDYIKFINTIAIKNNVEIFERIKSLEHNLEKLLVLKDIANKSTVAVGGGFSAGKSQFITSFFKNQNIKLPTGIKPVTAIVSYIVNGDREEIRGYSYNGGIVDISLELYSQISHEFIKELGFNLKSILPMIAIETAISEYKDICFVDTPGFNPSDSGFTNSDEKTANEYLKNANALIWTIGVDTNGTIPQSDLDFLEGLDLENKKLYIVANKANLKPQTELEDILDCFEEILDDYGFKYEGISAYDSILKKEFLYKKISLKNFLSSVNKGIISRDTLRNELNNIFNFYEEELNKREKILYKKEKLTNKLKETLEKIEKSNSENHKKVSCKIQNKMNTKIQNYINRLRVIKQKTLKDFDTVLDDIFK